ncbi:MAG: hypothetical protein KF874_13945 [Rhizobiaceae bacterium]|nr:hypothetical protein [Rhizobiaceae bacterium]
MSTLELGAPSIRAVSRGAIVRRAVGLIELLYKLWANRQAFDHLCEFSDIELQDIGLKRDDLLVAKTLGRNPTRFLGDIVKGRTQ